jgi:uncharacterized membrane protein YgdD (TMEM256/DUF423 family)
VSWERLFFGLGAWSALISVAAGAFGAHALRGSLAPELLAAFETAARYQMYHALGLLAIARVASRWRTSLVRWAGGLFVGGTLLFSGSLYALALTGNRRLGAVTPIGGAAFLTGWICLALASRRE